MFDKYNFKFNMFYCLKNLKSLKYFGDLQHLQFRINQGNCGNVLYINVYHHQVVKSSRQNQLDLSLDPT